MITQMEEINMEMYKSGEILGLTDIEVGAMEIGRYFELINIKNKINKDGREHIRSDRDPEY